MRTESIITLKLSELFVKTYDIGISSMLKLFLYISINASEWKSNVRDIIFLLKSTSIACFEYRLYPEVMSLYLGLGNFEKGGRRALFMNIVPILLNNWRYHGTFTFLVRYPMSRSQSG